MTEIKGWHVFGIFALAFGVIISVNLTLAFNAVRTFPVLRAKIWCYLSVKMAKRWNLSSKTRSLDVPQWSLRIKHPHSSLTGPIFGRR